MKEQYAEEKGLANLDPSQIQRIEADWTESEWFQVWLELARRPHGNQKPERELAGHLS